MATVKDAVDLTTRTIDRRALHYRNLVVLLVLVIMVCAVWAVVSWSGLPLLGWLFLLPLCGGFLVFDSHLVNRWRERILRMWTQEELDLKIFAECIASIRMLPPGTLGAMLATLPTSDHAPAMKHALAVTLTSIHCGESDRTSFGILANTAAAAAVAAAVLPWSWIPLAGVLLVVPLFALERVVRAARWRGWHRALVALQREQGLEPANFVALSAKLDWGSIPAEAKQRLLHSLPLVG
jgi:hypothetical protein